tara:strand:+ start:503 stop:1030 length:528 start_codon:yes stop_codon:yes gene_type:complete
MNFPNILSLSRIFLTLPIILFFESSLYYLSAFIFLVAAITDFLDGFIARKRNQASELGALLDLLADKIFVSILLIWMTFNFQNGLIFISAVLIITREISVSYLRLFFISQKKELNDLKADSIGKIKTVFQMTGLGFLLISPYFSIFFLYTTILLVLFSAFLSWYSLFKYLNKWNV